MEVLNTRFNVLALLLTPLLIGCGIKQYNEGVPCADQATVFADELTAPLEGEAATAMDRYLSLAGSWQAILDCQGADPQEVEITIDEVRQTNLEFYLEDPDSVCNAFGLAMFEVSFGAANDDDLSLKTFVMTAELYKPKTDPGYDDILLTAKSEMVQSASPDLASIQLTLQVDYDEQLLGQKVGITNAIDAGGGVVSQTQGTFCQINNWQRP